LVRHNWHAAQAGVLGGLGAAMTLAFCGPFWMAATRLYPHTFHLSMFFLVLNFLLAYLYEGQVFSLLMSVFLLCTFSLESPLFMLFLPIGGLILIHALSKNETMTFYRVLGCVLIGVSGMMFAVASVMKVATYCSGITVVSPRIVFSVFGETLLSDITQWITSYSWKYVLLLFLLPLAIAVYVFSQAFFKRSVLLLVAEIGLAITLLPSLLNLKHSIWGIARMHSIIPIFSYVAIAFFVGLLVAVWYLMRDVFLAEENEDLEFYEYRDNAAVCKTGAYLCWPLLLLLVVILPFRSFPDIQPKIGIFADEIAQMMYRSLGDRDWVVNNHLLRYHLMLQAYQDGRRLRFISTETVSDNYNVDPLLEIVRTEPALRARLWDNVTRVHGACVNLGLLRTPCESPIVAVALGKPEYALDIWHGLMDHGLYVNLIAPPASPGNYLLLRCSLSAAHTDADVQGIIDAFSWLAEAHGVNVFHL